jgi:hypothetical protein
MGCSVKSPPGPGSPVTCNCDASRYHHGNSPEQKCEYENLCVTQRNPCTSPLRGDCIPNNGAFSCRCKDPFYGDHCQWEDECQKGTPCANGVCNRKENSYSCTCNAGFYKDPPSITDNCLRRDPCHLTFKDEDSCQNDGECIRVDDFALSCACTDYVGARCEWLKTKVRKIYPPVDPATVTLGQPYLFILVVEVIGDQPYFKVDFGDGFSFVFRKDNLKPVTDRADRAVLTPAGIKALEDLPDQSKTFNQI